MSIEKAIEDMYGCQGVFEWHVNYRSSGCPEKGVVLPSTKHWTLSVRCVKVLNQEELLAREEVVSLTSHTDMFGRRAWTLEVQLTSKTLKELMMS